ncbi:MAG: hypothetical protein AAF492_30405, partial [Verrucomicrobiota bacterium]
NPWTTEADGTGYALIRNNRRFSGNDWNNWSIGTPLVHAVLDADGDGMGDAWETIHFGDLSEDGTGDFDGDGANDLDEFLAGTTPNDPASRLYIWIADQSGPNTTLAWPGVRPRFYSVLTKTNYSEPWQPLVGDLPAAPPVNAYTNSEPGHLRRYYSITIEHP